MIVIAIETRLDALASCAETNVMTRNGYQIVTDHEVFFVSKERFLKKYKGNLYIIPGTKGRLLTFDEANSLRQSIVRIENDKPIRLKGKSLSERYTKGGISYDLILASSDVEIEADDIFCQFAGKNNNLHIDTKHSKIYINSSNSTIGVRADRSLLEMRVSDCFIELSGREIDIVLIGNNNIVCGITDGINVFTRGRKNEFFKKSTSTLSDFSDGKK